MKVLFLNAITLYNTYQVVFAVTYSSNTSVSSDPLRVCVCDSYGVPQCEDDEFVFMHREVYPGETFTIPSVIVGYDYGPTTGVVYAGFLPNEQSFLLIFDLNSQNGHVISNSKQCTSLNFTLFTNHIHENSNVTMYINAVHMDMQTMHEYSLSPPAHCNNRRDCERTTPIFLNITLLQCLVTATFTISFLVAATLSVEWVTSCGTILCG